MKKSKNNFVLYLATFFVSIMIFLLVAAIKKIFPFGENVITINDSIPQYIPMLTSLRDKVLFSESLQYSFKGGLGYNFYGTMSYYLMSPFNLIIFLFKKENIKYAAQVIIILKMSFLSSTMTYYLKNKFKNGENIYIILFSLSYEFSYFFIGYMHNFIWLDSIMLLPIIMIGLENMDKPLNRIQYCISLTLCMICNFYIAGIICIFLFIYFFVVHNINKEIFKKFIRFSLFSILSAMIASFVLIPMVYTLKSLQTFRTSLPGQSNFNNILYIFEQHLPLIGVKTGSRNNGDLNIFINIFVLFLSSLFVFNKKVNKERKIKTITLMIFFLISFNNEFLNWIMHGCYLQKGIPNRFAFLYVFILTTIAYENFINIKFIDKKYIIWVSSILILLPSINRFIQQNYTSETNFSIKTLLYITVFLSIYLIVLFKINNKTLRKILINSFVLIEICFNLSYIPTTQFGDCYKLQTKYENAIAKYKDKYNDFHRSEILIIDSHNANSMYGINGIATFNSIFNPRLPTALGNLGLSCGENYSSYYGHTPITDALFGVKYIFSQYEELLPFNWEKIDRIDDINVYENKYYLPIAYKCELDYSNMNKTNVIENINEITKDFGILYSGIYINPEITGKNVKFIKKDNNHYWLTAKKGSQIKLEIRNVSEKNVYIYNNISAKSRTTILLNDRVITSAEYFGYISYLGNINKTDTITVIYDIFEDIENIDSYIFLSSMNEYVFLDFYNDTMKNIVLNVKYTENTVKCEYTTETDDIITFSIVYDDNWNCKVNGEKIDLKDDLFLKVPVKKGENEIMLKYENRRLIFGIITSIIGIIILIIYSIREFFL